MVRIEYNRLQLFHYACKFHNVNITRDGRHMNHITHGFLLFFLSISYVIFPTGERNVKYRRELKNE